MKVSKRTGTTTVHMRSTTVDARKARMVEVISEEDKMEMEKDEVMKRGVQLKALYELLKIREGYKGVAKRGDIKAIVAKYQTMRFKYITRGSMNYAVMVHNNKKKPLSSILHDTTLETGVSDLTGTTCNTNDAVIAPCTEITVHNGGSNKGGRKKGSTVAAKCQHKKTVHEALTLASNLCYIEYKKAQDADTTVSSGTYARIVKQVETDNVLDANTIKIGTILSRIKRNNLSGYAPQRTSPLAMIEPLVVQYCQRLAEMGAPLTRDQVIGIAESAIKGNIHYQNLLNYKQKLHLKVPVNDDDTLIGTRWYYGFLERHKDLIRRGKGKVKDVKRHTWCTYVHFEEMYNCVYNAMLKAKVPFEVEHETAYDREGNIVDTDSSEVYGKPSKFHICNPERILFVDECGSNTNQKSDGQVGGQRFIFSKGCDNTGTLGSNTDLHFTVLCFNNALGAPVLCAVILKSKKSVSEVPLGWQFGIDITRHLHGNPEGDKLKFFLDNSGPGGAMRGGPSCYYNGNKIPCFVGTSPNASITSTLL